jgi:hypothetical protein
LQDLPHQLALLRLAFLSRKPGRLMPEMRRGLCDSCGDHSDTLLIFLLRAKAPDKYLHASKVYIDKRERIEHRGTVGVQPIPSDHAVSIDQFPIELRRQMLAFLRSREKQGDIIEGKLINDRTWNHPGGA